MFNVPPACIMAVDQAKGVAGQFAFRGTAVIAYLEKPWVHLRCLTRMVPISRSLSLLCAIHSYRFGARPSLFRPSSAMSGGGGGEVQGKDSPSIARPGRAEPCCARRPL